VDNDPSATLPPTHHVFYEIAPVPAALIQLLIIILVVLFVLLLCKCNKLMAYCQHVKTPEELEDERYHDDMRFKDYLCYLCIRCKHTHRKRRHRKFIRKKFVDGGLSEGGGRLSRAYSVNPRLSRVGGMRKRKASIIFRRRSAICQPAGGGPIIGGGSFNGSANSVSSSYRNKNRRRTTRVKLTEPGQAMAGAVIDEAAEFNKNDENLENLVAAAASAMHDDDYEESVGDFRYHRHNRASLNTKSRGDDDDEGDDENTFII
jgi:hypothetical protein